MKHRAFLIELQEMSTLLSVMTQVSCLGSQLTHVAASENVARIAVLVADRVQGHFANRLRSIVGVIDLVEVDKAEMLEATQLGGLRVIQHSGVRH